MSRSVQGRVTARGLTWFPLTLFGREEIHTEGLVDTGFEDGLSLPNFVATRLGFVPVFHRMYELADGSPVRSPICVARVRILDQAVRTTAVLADTDEVLIGTRLLRACRLTIRYARRTARLEPDR